MLVGGLIVAVVATRQRGPVAPAFGGERHRDKTQASGCPRGRASGISDSALREAEGMLQGSE